MPFMTNSMKSDYDVSANWAELFVTIDDHRYTMAVGKHFEATANISSREVKTIGKGTIGHKNELVDYSWSMTLYKATEIFDDLIEKYLETGVFPRFTIQCSNCDPAVADEIGRSTKVFNDCILDGDVLLALADSEGGSVEQELSGFAESITRPEKYTVPSFM